MSLEYEAESRRERQLAAKRLRAENAALAAEVERLKAINQRTYCAYCGHEEPIDGDGSLIGEHISRCERHPMRGVERELADLRAIFDSPRVMMFADGREPTTNERHLMNLLEWARKDQLRAVADRLDAFRRQDEAAKEVERLKGEASAWARLVEWCEVDPDRDVQLGRSHAFLYAPGGKTAKVYIWHNATERMLPHHTIYLGTPEREATLAECVVAALDLWAKLYGEGKDGGQ